MGKYYHLCRQEPPDVYHQTPQQMLILVLVQLYSNWFMSPELASKYNW